MISRQRWIRALLVLLTVEAVFIADPIRPWLPFSFWTFGDQSVTGAGLLAFVALVLIGAFVRFPFPGLRPLPVTFPLIGACLLLYGLPPAAALALLTVLLVWWREGADTESDAPEDRLSLGPTLAGIGIGLLVADISGYLLPKPPLTREAFNLVATLGTGALLAAGAVVAALMARHLAGSESRKDASAAGLGATLLGAAATAALALAATQAVRLWGLGPVALVLGAPFAAMAPVALVLSKERRTLALTQGRVRGLTEVLEALALAIEAKDRVSAHHLSRMRVFAAGLGRRLGLSAEELEGLDLATLLHDIGKLAVPEWILSKPGSLTEEEFQKMTLHSDTASRILRTVPFARDAAPIVKHHHEHFDGNGYPEGLAGLEIPIGARILAVVDAMDSIMSERAYHHALGATQALAYIQAKSGTVFDPRVVKTLVENYNALTEEAEEKASALDPQARMKRVSAPAENEMASREASTGMQGVLDRIASSHMEIYSLHEIGQALGKALNVEESLTLIASRLNSLFHYSACAVYVFDSERRVLVPRLTAGRGAETLKSLEIPLGAGLSGWAAREKRSILSTPPEEPILRGAIRSDFDGIEDTSEVSDLVSCVAAPLVSGLEVVGVIALYDTASATYSPAEERLLTMVGRQVGAAIRTVLLFERTQEHSLTDFLTGLPNARYMFAMAEQAIAKARETGEPFSILIMNLDGFARVNEEFGHPAGDRYLIGVSKVIRSQMRDPDTCVRYSGDEFVAILPGVGREETIQVAERIERAVASFTVDVRARKQVGLTISTGHATQSLDGLELEDLMRVAQDRLSRRKVTLRSAAASPTLIPFRRNSNSSSN